MIALRCNFFFIKKYTVLVICSRAGFPYGAAEIFSLMQHMGCEPDRASYNIMVDAYGRAGLHEGMSTQITFNSSFIDN